MRFPLSILFIIGALTAQAQVNSTPGARFRVDVVKGCAPLTIRFESLAPGFCVEGNIPCVIDIDGNGTTDFTSNNITNPANFPITYTNPGTYTLTVGYQGQGTNPPEQVTITVVPNIQPAFDLFTCSGNAVQVKVRDTNYNQYFISYSDGASLTVPSGSLATNNHTFASGGAKTISVRGINLNAKDNCNAQVKSFTAVPALPLPSLTAIHALSPTTLEINYSLPVNVLGRIDIATNTTTTFQQLKTPFADARDTLSSGINNEASFYCFRIGAVDACSNSVAYNTTTACSIGTFAATAQDGFNRLTWQNNQSGITNYTIDRDDNVSFNAAVANSFNDNNADCNVRYCYEVTANYPGAISTSLSQCASSFSNQKPPNLTDLSVSISNTNQAELTWADQTVAVEYSIFKSTNGGPYVFDRVQADPPYTDASFSVTNPSCYEITYTNACNNASDLSPEACPVVVTASLQPDNTVNLSWTAYQGWQNGVSGYRLERYSKTGTILRVYSIDNGTTTFKDEEEDLFNQVSYYRVFALPVDIGLTAAQSNLVEVIKRPNLFFATAFTPDGQGPNQNEKFRVFGQYILGFEVKIFNRWGELIFSTDDIDEGWDGTFKGKDQPDGTYAFVATITDFAGRASTRSGSVLLIRKR
jgi:gliding motility-associated-like protein